MHIVVVAWCTHAVGGSATPHRIPTLPGTSRAAQWTAQRSDDGAGVLGACSHAPAITWQSVAAMGARIRRFSFLVHPYAERMRAQRERLPTLVGEAVVGGRVWPAAGATVIG